MLGVPRRRGGRWRYRGRPSVAPPGLWSLFVDLSGQQPRSAGGVQYLMIIVDDYSRMGWPLFLKRKFDVQMVFAGFLADISARGAQPSSSAFARTTALNLLSRSS